MTHRQPRTISLAVALSAAIGLALTSCTLTGSGDGVPSSPETAASSKGEGSGTAVDDEAAIASPKANGLPNSETAPSNEKASANDKTAQSTAPLAPGSGSAPSPAQSGAESSQKPEAQAISIDETICGAGGQEAYFETKAQEIYICKNEAEALTYIATPKQKGNSLFLPAQKIQQGDLVGYAAIDETKTYIVTSGGFQLQDNGKPTKSEKVIRRQLAQN